MNRRSFVKKAIGITGVGIFSSLAFVPAQAARRRRGEKAGAAGEMTLTTPGKGMAGNVNYQHDKAKITDAKVKVANGGTAWKDQYCKNCVLYTAEAGKKIDGHNVGKCTLFPKEYVAEMGWCSTWNLKK